MKVSKRIERLARAIHLHNLHKSGFVGALGYDRAFDKVDECWGYFIDEAKDINENMNMFKDFMLDGEWEGATSHNYEYEDE